MRLANWVSLPTVVTSVGQYRTRGGEIVTVTSIDKSWARGHYANNVSELWDISGRLLPSTESRNDIVQPI